MVYGESKKTSNIERPTSNEEFFPLHFIHQ